MEERRKKKVQRKTDKENRGMVEKKGKERSKIKFVLSLL